jgi:CSLREA domain-containing protein
LLGLLLAVGSANAQVTFWVDSVGDEAAVNPKTDGICDAQPGPSVVCTLRAAIEEANAVGGTDTINFNIGGGGVQTINILSALPTITETVIIDGTTQGGYGSTPLIELNGGGASIDGLVLSGVASSGSTIRALSIYGFEGGRAGIRIRSSSSGNFIYGNHLGTASTPNGVGLILDNVSGNQIGGTGVAPPDRNVISGNAVDGVQMFGAGTTGNFVQGNYIGLDATGMNDLGNTGQGLAIFLGPSSNTIGGTAPGEGNVISGNDSMGMLIADTGTSGNLIQGNKIGTDAAGTAGVGNTLAGIHFDNPAANNTIGGTAANAGNLIAFNGNGIQLTGTVGNGNEISSNSIHSNTSRGIDLLADGAVMPNDIGDGDSGPNNLQNFPVLSAAATNGFGSAHFAGSLNSTASTNYRVEFFSSTAADSSGYGEGENYLGFTNITTDGSGNAAFGVSMVTATPLVAGEYVTATATDLTTNDTSEFSKAIVAVAAAVVTSTTDDLDGTITSVAALIAAPGPDGFISLREAITAANNTAGAHTIDFGIPLTDPNHFYYADDGTGGSLSNVTATTLDDSEITFDPDYPGAQFSWFSIQPGSVLPTISDALILNGYTQPGAQANTVAAPGISDAILKIVLDGSLLSGSEEGFVITSGSATIRGLVINQFPDRGIELRTGGANVIEGNYIGTDATGTVQLGNGYGVEIRLGSNGNTIGGTTPGARNLLSGSLSQDGVYIREAGTNSNTIQGNFIGTDVTGTADLGNNDRGVHIDNGASFNTIGGIVPEARNIISGNDSDGIHVADFSALGTTGNVIQGNYIGTDVTGALPLKNDQHGVHLGNVTNTSIGGSADGAGNVIAHNQARGIYIGPTALTGNSFLRNSIHSNGGLGIDLNGDGVTSNDEDDLDLGPNDLLNWPYIYRISESGGTLTVDFSLDVPAGFYRIEFFKNPSGADPSGNGEGEVYASSRTLTHGGLGYESFNHSFPGVIGEIVTATATFCTDGATCSTFGNTSEFGRAFTQGTTAVELISFDAFARDGAVDIVWETGSELNNLGFHLYRSLAADGRYDRITDSLIPGLGSSPVGASYSFHDGGLANGTRYFYRLEDIETTGRSELHGPVSATPRKEADSSDEDQKPEETSRITYGDPSDVSLHVIERDSRGAVIELVTGGFFATPQNDGTVRLAVPGFEEPTSPGLPALPIKRTWLEATAGRRVRITSVQELDQVSFAGLRPTLASEPEIIASRRGTVRANLRKARKARRVERAFLPAARVVETGFQGDVKKALVELSPFRLRGTAGLTLARRLVVRVSFDGVEPKERVLNRGRGRRIRERGRRNARNVLIRLATEQPGLYRVRFEEIFATRRRALSATSLRLSRLGETVPFHLEPPNGSFGPGTSLYFMSPGESSNPYENEAVFELEWGSGGEIIQVYAATPQSIVVDGYLHRSDWEENRYYQAGLLDAPSLWQWDMLLSPVSRSYPFILTELVEAPARLEVWLQGASDFPAAPDHHLRMSVNGSVVGESSWDGKAAKRVEVELPAGLLREGQNDLAIENVGDTSALYSMVFLDHFAVTYARRLVADAGRFEGSFGESGIAKVQGLGKGSLLIQTSPNLAWIRDATVTSAGLSFNAEAGRSYLAVSPPAVLRADVRKPIASRLRDTRNRADYLLIGPRELLSVAQPLLERRREQGLFSRGVAIEDIYNEFGYGEARPEAVKDFLEYVYHHWRSPSLRYVVLLGDATYDGKDYLQTGTENRVPTLVRKTSYLWTASDPGYAAVNGEDLLPDLALGRLPAANAEEARALVEKVLAYEASQQELGGPVVLVADNPDLGGNFEADSDKIASQLIDHDLEKIYVSQLGSAGTRRAILSAFDRGASLMSYVGHGGIALWTSENVFANSDIEDLSLQAQQPILMTMNCLNGYFHFPYFDALGEALVKAEGKGAIAALSPSGLSLDAPAHLYHVALVEEITSGGHARLGDAVLAAQATYADSGAFPELLVIYHLFGDPALMLR